MFQRPWARVAATLTVVAALGVAPRALADDDPTTTAAARERFKEGVAFFDQKQYEKARAAFLQAYALRKHPAVLLNLAQSEVRSGHERDAAKHFAQFLREAADASPAQREAAEEGLKAARAAVVELGLDVDEAGAEVLVDGTLEGLSPLPDPLYLDPGSHTIEARKGERSATQSVTGKAGERKELRLTLATSAPPATAKRPATTDAKGPDEEAGIDDTAHETGGREPFLTWVTSRPAGLISGGATILFGLGAGGFAIGANARYGDADATAESINKAAREDEISTRGICSNTASKVASSRFYDGLTDDGQPLPPDQASEEFVAHQDRVAQYTRACENHTSFVGEGDTFRSLAIGLGVGAGVAAVATVVLYFTTAPRSGEGDANAAVTPSFSLVPWASPDAAGLSAFGRF